MSSKQIKVPTVGESISEVTIGRWVKNDGDYVNAEEVICELESDKATFEVTAESAGILHTKAKQGDVLPIGGLICEIESKSGSGETKSVTPPSATPTMSKSGEIIEMKVPTVGESISEVTVGKWNKNTGDFVNAEEIICELESDKATFELNAATSGILEVIAATGQVVPIGGLLCKIAASEGAPATKAAPKNDTPSVATSSNANYAQGHSSPAAGKILAEKGLSAQEIKGTGKDGRITKEDALNAQAQSKPAVASTASSTPAAASAPAGPRAQRREKMTSLRKTVAKRLVSVKNETAMLTTFNEVDMKPIMDLRAKYKDSFKEKHQVGLGFMSFFTKACCIALQEFPAVNAYIDGEEIVYNSYCDVSIAVSAPKGLVVPVIRNAEQLSFDGVEKEVVRLATKAKENKLSIEEMQGGTFTITNGGIFGSMLSTPIINAPQSAILGMHNIVERPVAQNGQVVIRPIMYVALSYDHRIIDGRESVGFLVRVKQLLEDPQRILLGV